MKVVYFNYLYDSHKDSVGASVHVTEFVSAMTACGYKIKAINLNPAPFAAEGRAGFWPALREVLKRHLKRYVGQVNQVLKNVPLFFREWKILSAEGADVLLVRYNMLNFGALIAARLQRIPVVLEVNSPHAFERKNLVKDVWQIPFLPFLIERLNMTLADRIVTVSQVLKSYYSERKISADKIFVIPNGVNTDRFNPEIDFSTVRAKYGLAGKTVLGFVGSFHHWHGITNLMTLIQKTVPQYPEIAYLLVGDGPLKPQLENFVTSNGLIEKVTLTGYVAHDEVPNHVAAMDIVLAPYPKMEFFYFSPLKLFEYLSAGKAVVASRIGQISEIIQDGENGVLYDPDDLNDLLQKTTRLIVDENERARISFKARESVLQRFSWEKNARQVARVLASACGSDDDRLGQINTETAECMLDGTAL